MGGSPYLVVLAVSVDHPVLPVGADLQLEGGDVVGLLGLLGDGALGGDAGEHFQSVEVHLSPRKEDKEDFEKLHHAKTYSTGVSGKRNFASLVR